MNNERLWTKDFISISLSSFFLFMVFYTLMATLPIFVLETLRQSESQIGLVVTVFLIASVSIRPFAGIWLDTIGRKKILQYSLMLLLISTFCYVIVNSFAVLLILRFVQGLAFGLATTAAGTVVAEIVPEKRRGEGMGYYGMAMSLAMVFGPYLGLTMISHFSFITLFSISGIFSILSLFFGLAVAIPVKIKKSNKTKIRISQLIEKSALPISVTSSLLAIGYSGIISFISVYARDLGLVDFASFFFIVYAVAILASRPFTGKLFDRKGENIIAYPGIILFTIGLLLLSIAHMPFLFLLSAAIIGLGYGSIVPSFQTLAVNSAAPEKRGMATATFFLFFDSGMGIGSFLLGIITAKTSFHTMYVFSSIIIAFTGIVYYLLHDRRKRTVLVNESKAA